VSATAEQFLARLLALATPAEREKYRRYFKAGAEEFVGVPMGNVFALAKEMIDMAPAEIERLLESPIHEARAGAVSVMNQQARRKRTPASRRQELFDLYLRRHDRIDNWDLVDLGAIHVVGGYLADKPRDVLYRLARSENPWERRTAIVSTAFFISAGEVDDTFRIGEMLLHDEHDLVQKAVGGWLRAAGGAAPARLLAFLDEHAATMARAALRYAIEHLDKERRAHYLGLGRSKAP
jgi:3-methyladenine DNA glycosylase AlkD